MMDTFSLAGKDRTIPPNNLMEWLFPWSLLDELAEPVLHDIPLLENYTAYPALTGETVI
jgi:hypothetical protein